MLRISRMISGLLLLTGRVGGGIKLSHGEAGRGRRRRGRRRMEG